MANIRARHMAHSVAMSLLTACAFGACAVGSKSTSSDTPAASTASPTYSLRARRVSVPDLIMFVSGSARGQGTIIGPEVGGMLSLDVERHSVSEIEREVVRASGVGSLVMGNTVVVGGPPRLAAATNHPLRPLLAAREYKGRRMTLTFTGARITNVLRALARASERQFEVTEGIEGRISIGVCEAPWDEILDALAVSNDLTVQVVNGTVRVSRRGDGSPHFLPLSPKFIDDSGAPQTEREGRCAASLDKYEPSQLHLDAVMTGPPPLPVAFVRYPNGAHTTLRKNYCTGSAGGVVSRIERNRLVFMDRQLGTSGTEVTVERILVLDGE